MKKLLMIMTMAVAGISMTGCSSSSDDGGGVVAPPEFTARQKAVSNGLSEFDLGFFAAANKGREGQNFVVSPLSASMVLSLVANGENDEVRQQICDALGTADVEALNILARGYAGWLPRADRDVRLSLAQSVWHNQNMAVASEFSKVASEYFAAPVYARDFGKTDELKRDINKWASDNTRGMIPEFLKELRPRVMAYVFNALYFKGKWSTKFDKAETAGASFHGARGTADVMMMHSRSDRGYAWDEDFQAVRLGFGGGSMSALLVMPDPDINLDDFIASRTSRIASLTKQTFSIYDVDLRLPRFSVTPRNSMPLDDVFAAMGISGLATPHESHIFEGDYTTATLFSQQCAVEFNEDGAEGAAVTDGEIAVMSPGPDISNYVEVTFDRPFLFLIVENTTGRVLFAGKVASL